MQKPTSESSDISLSKSPIFNGKYEMIRNIGKGKTAKVYLVKDKEDPSKLYALKLVRHKYLMSAEKNIHSIEKEIEVLKGLEHENVIRIHEYGCDGTVVKSSDKELKNQVYIMTEYISGGTLFDLVEKLGPMREEAGRSLFSQILKSVTYMHKLGVAHRDLKLENILLDENFNIKIADFGFATYSNVKKLESFKGTKTYMAPEIREQKVYNGKKSDIFAAGVILFTLVFGIFPFQDASKNDKYYKLLMSGDSEKYWTAIGVSGAPLELQDLLFKMLSADPNDRPSLKEIEQHPWMTPSDLDLTSAQTNLSKKFSEYQTSKSAVTHSTNDTDQEEALHQKRSESIKLPELVPKMDPNLITNPEIIDITHHVKKSSI